MTLVPAMAEDVAHITMLQRSPTYVVSRPSRDVFANRLRRFLPERLAYAITRRGGTTVTSGLSHPEHRMQISHVNLVVEERTIKGSYLGSCVPGRDIPHYIELFQHGKLPVDALISSKIALEDINESFDYLADGVVVRQIITF